MTHHLLLPATLLVVFFVLFLVWVRHRTILLGTGFSLALACCILSLIINGHKSGTGWIAKDTGNYTDSMIISDSSTTGIRFGKGGVIHIDTTQMPEVSQYDKYDNGLDTASWFVNHSEIKP